MSELHVTDPERLNYEINLECDACGHAQFLHCDSHDDPCGCIAMHRRGQITRDSCHCPGFKRPHGALTEHDAVWWDHGHEEAG